MLVSFGRSCSFSHVCGEAAPPQSTGSSMGKKWGQQQHNGIGMHACKKRNTYTGNSKPRWVPVDLFGMHACNENFMYQ